MITSTLLALIIAATPTCDHDPMESAEQLLEQAGMACYGIATNRRALPLRENYMALSPVVGQIRRGTVFIGQRVTGENKILVYSPNVEGPIGLARNTFARRVSSAYCRKEDRLYSPAADEIKGWGRAPEGDMPLPTAPGNNYSAACYQHKTSKAVFWGNRPLTEDNRYTRRVVRLSNGGRETANYPLWAVTRIAIAQCESTD